MTDCLRTPETRFIDLPGYEFAPNYVSDLPGYDGLRVHYLDENADPLNDQQAVFLCLHGQPTWSYLYRKMIPVFTAAGGRVIAPDLLGFGRSDKPVDENIYTFDFHRSLLVALIERLDLTKVTLVCQDWGGILGLTIPPEMPERFDRLIVMNTAMPVGTDLGQGFADWRAFSSSKPDMDIAGLMHRSESTLTEAEAKAYAAPFPDANHKAGVRRFPELVMTDPNMQGVERMQKARLWWANEWQGKSFMAVGANDPVLGLPIMNELRQTIKRCPEPMVLERAGHFVQEHGDVVARGALKSFESV